MSNKYLNSSTRGLALSISRKVFKHGNSLALTLPWTFVHGLNIKLSQTLFFQLTKAGNMVISDKPLHTLGSFGASVHRAVTLLKHTRPTLTQHDVDKAVRKVDRIAQRGSDRADS